MPVQTNLLLTLFLDDPVVITVVGVMMKQTNHKFAFVWELNKWSMEKVVFGGH